MIKKNKMMKNTCLFLAFAMCLVANAQIYDNPEEQAVAVSQAGGNATQQAAGVSQAVDDAAQQAAGLPQEQEAASGDVVIPAGQAEIPDSAYYKNMEMTSLTIPASVVKIGQNVVDHCFKLVYITVDADNPNYKSVGGVVYTKDGKTLVLCPPGKTGEFVVPAQAKTLAPYAFRTCKKLTSIVLPDGITEIPDGAFMGCWGLEKVNLPQGLKRIGKHAFDGTIVQKMNMPTTMEFIDDEAFINTSLVEVNLRVTQPFELGEDVFGEIYVTRLNVPAAGLQNFKKHPKWGKFGRITPTHSYWTVKLP